MHADANDGMSLSRLAGVFFAEYVFFFPAIAMVGIWQRAAHNGIALAALVTMNNAIYLIGRD